MLETPDFDVKEKPVSPKQEAEARAFVEYKLAKIGKEVAEEREQARLEKAVDGVAHEIAGFKQDAQQTAKTIHRVNARERLSKQAATWNKLGENALSEHRAKIKQTFSAIQEGIKADLGKGGKLEQELQERTIARGIAEVIKEQNEIGQLRDSHWRKPTEREKIRDQHKDFQIALGPTVKEYNPANYRLRSHVWGAIKNFGGKVRDYFNS